MRGLKAHLLLAFGIYVLLLPLSSAQKISVLYDFGSGSQDPVQPSYSGIIAQGRDGNLYSTSPYSLAGDGAAFSITPNGTLTVVYSFTSGASGTAPYSGLVLGTDGNFYGTTESGGNGDGIVFKLSPNGQLNVLYDFAGGSGGGSPYAPPIQATDGNLYGTTAEPYYNQGVYGTVYKLTPQGELTTLYQFDQAHGTSPYAPLVQGSDGDFYGVTLAGGNLNLGVIFRMSPSGKLTVLYNFDGAHGSHPYGPLVQGNDGSFYGTTFNGGTHGSGVIFQMQPNGRLKVIHNFEGSGGGFYPCTGLVQASDGNLYGTTHGGGAVDAGTIFKISPDGQYAVLSKFDGTDGKFPMVTLTQHTNGILYGDTNQGGTVSACQGNCGTFYSLDLGLPAFVSLAPLSGKVGKTIEFLGQGFTGTTAVSFNGVDASFKAVSDTFLTAIVPHGATTGFVQVTTPGGGLKSNREFHVTK
ncbi:MAG: choice-of-anchor tandem repeat GloVer-containing protein [Terriglobales bacterium]|jgi:uncharacterized repeat protein (TIGR03803 family)